MRVFPAVCLLFVAALTIAHAAPQSAKSKTTSAPEVFNARATVGSAAGRGDAYITIRVDKYSTDKDLDAMEKALANGSGAFVSALRAAPVVGHFEVGDKKFNIRWARMKPTSKG